MHGREAFNGIRLLVDDRRAALGQPLNQGVINSIPQSPYRDCRKQIGWGFRVNSGLEQRLVGIDVAHSGNESLIENRCFDRDRSTAQ